MEVLIKRFGIVSVAKIGAIIGLAFGLIEGFFIGLFIAAIGSAAPMLFPAFLGFGGLLATVIIVGIIGLIGGFIVGAVWAFIYNAAASLVGPIEVNLETQS